MKEETKKIFSGSEVGALIEDFEHQVKLVAEGVASLNQKFDREFGEIRQELVQIRNLLFRKADIERLEALEQRVTLLEQKIK